MSLTAGEIEAAPVLHVPEIGSTNEEALVRARRGEAGPFWIRADRQLAGRGRHGRAWDSPVGNLYCSLMFRTVAEPDSLPQVSQVAAVALVRAIEQTAGPLPNLRIKWPNDLLIGSAKVAGILVEATRTAEGAHGCVVGCGVNCGRAPEGLPYTATSLAASFDAPVVPGALFDRLRAAMAEMLGLWDDGRNYGAIRALWLERALPLETRLTVRSGSAPLSGRFQGIDAKGRLLLLGPEGPLTVEAGEVMLSEVPVASGG